MTKQKYNFWRNALSSVELIKTKPIILLPFILIAFFQFLALEIIYFSIRKPLVIVLGPVIKKFFGENFLRYPGNLLFLPNMLYYAETVIYACLGIALTAVTANIIKNLKEGLPVKAGPLVKNALRRYVSYITFGIIMVALIVLLKKADTFVYSKAMRFAFKHAPDAVMKVYVFGLTAFLFFSNIILQMFFIFVIPLMVVRKRSLLRALGQSVYAGIRNFFGVFSLVFVVYLVYFPITLLKAGSLILVDRTFPEISLIVAVAGVVLALFIDGLVTVCATQYVLDTESPESAS